MSSQGNIPHDTPDAGNPIKIGGKGTASIATDVTEGDRVNASFTLGGVQRVIPVSAAGAAAVVDTELPAAIQMADNMALPIAPQVLANLMGYDNIGANLDMPRLSTSGGTDPTGPFMGAMIQLYDTTSGTLRLCSARTLSAGSSGSRALPMTNFNHNGSTYDPQMNNHELTALASAARTASVDSADLVNYNGRGIVVTIDVTAVTADPSMVVTIQGKSSLGSDYYTILASAAIVGTGVTVLRVAPGLTTAANLVANDLVPRIFRISVANADSDSITYSVSVNVCQ